jgi:cyclopropane-fatty-acyl-phospholipid synthase
MGVTPNVRVAAKGGTARLHAALSAGIGTDQWTLVDWHGTAVSGVGEPRFTLKLQDRSALGALLSTAPERGFGRAYANGRIQIDPLRRFLEVAQGADHRRLALSMPRVVLTALAAGVRPAAPPPTSAEARLSGRRHSAARDAAAIRHHYDLPVEFYQLWLDRTMTYSCAYFETGANDLDSAQAAKLDLVCRKLRLKAGEHLLDIGSGWGSLALHAAAHFGVHATGITISPTQFEYSAMRARQLGLDHVVDFQLRDYRRVDDDAYDAIASIGMVEHVGRARMPTFAAVVHRALKPGGRALIHGHGSSRGTVNPRILPRRLCVPGRRAAGHRLHSADARARRTGGEGC